MVAAAAVSERFPARRMSSLTSRVMYVARTVVIQTASLRRALLADYKLDVLARPAVFDMCASGDD